MGSNFGGFDMKNLRIQEKHSRSWWSQNNRLRVGAPKLRRSKPLPGGSRKASENWKLDEHWVAISAYLAQMDFPNEG